MPIVIWGTGTARLLLEEGQVVGAAGGAVL